MSTKENPVWLYPSISFLFLFKNQFNKILIAYVTIKSRTDFCHITLSLHKSISTLVSPNTTATSVNTTAHVPEVPEVKEKEPAEKSYTGTAGLGSLGR